MAYRVVVRVLVATLGICSIAWALDVVPIYRADDPIIETAQRILAGEDFTPAQLDALRHDLAVRPDRLRLAAAESGSVTIRSQWLQDQLKQGTLRGGVQKPLDELRSRVDVALARAPTDSFMWLAAFWLSQHDQASVKDIDLLRMSYLTGGHEGWIALRRSPLALSMLGKLPDQLASQALSEFRGLLRSGFYMDAANILAGPAWGARDQLLKQLDGIDETDRKAFAEAVNAKDLPGLEIDLPRARPNRPF
jgi:hypothetical protein